MSAMRKKATPRTTGRTLRSTARERRWRGIAEHQVARDANMGAGCALLGNRWCAALGTPARNERAQLLEDHGIHRRRLEGGQGVPP